MISKFLPIIFLNKFPVNSPETTSTLDFDNDLLRESKIVFSHRKELAAAYIMDTKRTMCNNLFFENINVKAKTKEQQDATGQGKAVEAQCAVLLQKRPS